ncbi:MAG: PVC-type heme-binding CxxCH protein [Planctomycetota bacterium]|nr:PVC-type heme-binding CxxCH protein [Planctomycetota bacterium]
MKRKSQSRHSENPVSPKQFSGAASSLAIIGLIILAMVAVRPWIVTAQQPKNQLPKKQHKTSNAPFLKPAEAVAKMSIPDGFDVSIFAAEPDIGEPIAFCFDDRGRIWVVENYNYRTRREHTGDKVTRIQILEDTNRDGVFDKKKTFTDKLTFTSGIALGFGGVFVGSPPNLSFIPDRDGNDLPDGPPEVLLNGWGINDRHETLNSFNWGPDGWLYGCHGVFTQSQVAKPNEDDSARQFIDGGIWRYHPTRKTFEVFARGLSNPWGFDFDDHGQGFATCCVIPHLFHVVQGGVYHKQSRPHVNPHIYDDIKTIRDHTHLSAHGGARIYLADAFPKQYRNRLFMCNIHEHAVLTDVLIPNGSSFIGQHGDDFMPTNDLAWVGFSVEIGPEGGVYILDWHDTDVCGNTINFPNSGRIYRITPGDAEAIAAPNLRSLTDEELVALQMHSNDWYVRQARVLLQSRYAADQLDQPRVHSLLQKQFDSATRSPKRLRAFWALHVTGGLNSKQLESALKHSDPYVRAWAIQLLGEESSVNAFQVAEKTEKPVLSTSVLKQLSAMAVEDSSAIVRLYLSSIAQRLPFENRWPILKGLAGHEEDIEDPNLPRMVWFGLEPMVPDHSQQAIQLAVAGKYPNLSGFVARRLLSDASAGNTNPAKKQTASEQNKTLQRVATGFQVQNVGERGVVYHTAFRNRTAVQTHPLNRETPCVLSRAVDVPANAKTELKISVSHHPHGDWQLRVLAGKEVLKQQIVRSSSVEEEWLEVTVDLSRFAGQKIELSLENRANDWKNEWAYWHTIRIVSHEP